MSDVNMQDRNSLLDAFARTEERRSEPGEIMPLTMTTSAMPDRIVGAQKVAVRRDEGDVLRKIKILASAAGEEYYYRFPVKKKGGGVEYVEGPSIKLANDLARTYGNCEIDCRVMDLGDGWIFYARLSDLETGYSITRPFQQRKSQRGMRTADDRALDIAFQIGASKAIRNVICNGLQTFADFAFEEARSSMVEKVGKKLEDYRQRTIDGLAFRDVDLHRVEAIIGRAAKDWLAPDIARIIAMMKSINDGMATVDETFPPLDGNADKTETDASPPQHVEKFAGDTLV